MCVGHLINLFRRKSMCLYRDRSAEPQSVHLKCNHIVNCICIARHAFVHVKISEIPINYLFVWLSSLFGCSQCNPHPSPHWIDDKLIAHFYPIDHLFALFALAFRCKRCAHFAIGFSTHRTKRKCSNCTPELHGLKRPVSEQRTHERRLLGIFVQCFSNTWIISSSLGRSFV